MMPELFAPILGYLLGSIPFGLILSSAGGAGDIRKIGSGNIGATNVLRTGRKGLAALTFFLDFAKGMLAVWLSQLLWGPEAGMVAGFAAVLGHDFPVWLRFKGGKGVATTAGVMVMAATPAGLAGISTWVLALILWRTSSVGALVALAMAPVFALAFHLSSGQIWLSLLLSLLGIARHTSNIRRLVTGTEFRIAARPEDS